MAFEAGEAQGPWRRTALQVLGPGGRVDAEIRIEKSELACLDFNDLLIGDTTCWSVPTRRLRKTAGRANRLLLGRRVSGHRSAASGAGQGAVRRRPRAASCFSWAITSSRSIVSAAPIRRFPPAARGESRGRPAAAVAEFPQPAGGAGVRQRPVREEMGPEYEPLRRIAPQVGPAPAVEFLLGHASPRRTPRRAVGVRPRDAANA